jgi:hypothetical protein
LAESKSHEVLHKQETASQAAQLQVGY